METLLSKFIQTVTGHSTKTEWTFYPNGKLENIYVILTGGAMVRVHHPCPDHTEKKVVSLYRKGKETIKEPFNWDTVGYILSLLGIYGLHSNRS